MKLITFFSFAHRDLKPENILIRADESVVVSDFGLARPIDPNGFMMTNVGSALYKAPEIFEKKRYSYQIDIWSLGTLLFFFLTGEDLF